MSKKRMILLAILLAATLYLVSWLGTETALYVHNQLNKPVYVHEYEDGSWYIRQGDGTIKTGCNVDGLCQD